MLTSLQCLARADKLDARARQCAKPSDRDAYIETADGWRRNAVLARQQEAWTKLHPDA